MSWGGGVTILHQKVQREKIVNNGVERLEIYEGWHNKFTLCLPFHEFVQYGSSHLCAYFGLCV